MILSLIFSAALYLCLIGVFPPRIFLSPYYIITLFVVVALFCIFIGYLLQKLKIRRYSDAIEKWTSKKKILIFGSIIMAIILLSSIKPLLDTSNDNKLREEAKTQFSINQIGQMIYKGNIDRTIIELENTLENLRNEFIESPPEYIIRVYIFSDVDELVRITHIPNWAAGGVLTIPGQSPIIFIPTEQEKSIWNNNLPTTTPAHEATHIVVYEAINQKDIELIDKFFREGMAEYESSKGFINLTTRIENRLTLVTYKDQIVRLSSVPTWNILDSQITQEDVTLFYLLSNEFITYLAHEHGEKALWQVLKDIGQGMDFYEAFKVEIRKEYLNAYSEFLAYFY